jgi:hypothetical protein
MVATLEDRVLDFGLNVLDTESSYLSVCSTEPTTIAIAATTGLLGFKSWGVGSVFGSPAAGSPLPSRKVTSVAVSDGTITTSGTASWWAVYAVGSLHAHGTLSSAQVVTAGNTFTLTAFDIKVPGS